jgi:hypothetical protein
MLFNIFVFKILICIHSVYFSLVQRGADQWQRERETGGWAHFDWMLDGGNFKSQPKELGYFGPIKS